MAPKRRIIPIFIPHAGCPHACVFCNQRHIAGSVRPPSVDEVAQLIADALPCAGGGAEVAFYGGSFTAIPEAEQNGYLMAVQPFLASGAVSGIRISTRPDCTSEETLHRLLRAGVRIVELGAQSMEDDVLALSGRGHTADDVRRAARMVKDAGLSLVLQVMCGLPGEGPLSHRRTAEAAAALRPDGARIYPAVVLPGTELAGLMQRGEYAPLSVQAAADRAADMMEIFEATDIPLIRVGLNPTESLSERVIAGAYHPAFGELAYGRLHLKRIARAMENMPAGTREAHVSAPRGALSAVIGHGGENRKILTARHPDVSFIFTEREEADGGALITFS